MSDSIEQRLQTAVAQFMNDPENLTSKQTILELISKVPDVSLVIKQILSGGRIKVASPGENIHFMSSAITISHSEQSSEQRSADLISPIGPHGEAHSEHLYFAAECVSKTSKIDNKIVEEIITKLLQEFDLEIAPPGRAICAFGDLSDRAVPSLMKYIRDSQRETFSREDAALALGKIGTDLVVRELASWLSSCEYSDQAMPLYALGFTRNHKAIPVVQNWLKYNPSHQKVWVAQDALNRLSKSY